MIRTNVSWMSRQFEEKLFLNDDVDRTVNAPLWNKKMTDLLSLKRAQLRHAGSSFPIAFKYIWILFLGTVLSLPFCVGSEVLANPMIHQNKAKIVDGKGNTIKLRGVLLEGWLMWNGTLWGAGLTSETAITDKLQDLIGHEETKRFQKQVFKNFITERDIEMISNMGFNVVRVPFNHTILEDDTLPYQYKESGWELLDQILSWCEKYSVYAVLDLHSAPGGQSLMFVNDPDGSGFYNSEDNIKRTVALWTAIASRYKDREIIAGFDLLNEPQLPWFATGDKLVEIYTRIRNGIRKVDKDHMLIFSGAGTASNDLSMFKTTLDSNQTLAFHTYNLFGHDIGIKEHRQFTKLSQDLSVPIWNGEIGAHTAEWVKAVIKMFEDSNNNISGWVFWPWKRVPQQGKRYRHLMAIQSTDKWDAVRNWVAGVWFAPKPSRQEALEGMQEFIEAMKADNLIFDSEMREIVTEFTTK